ncbi:hypothetical protein HII31_00490 [Pseudocercospora fuligena]|uniref:Uncharacterized protein n=1 Tax=Pseudocercospora fuligena TaxID=685502 RepID=A0A8H6VRR0_9PEZI|nr:hypothetical protein HII31_00490 [Pseudocercospora fuligena]
MAYRIAKKDKVSHLGLYHHQPTAVANNAANHFSARKRKHWEIDMSAPAPPTRFSCGSNRLYSSCPPPEKNARDNAIAKFEERSGTHLYSIIPDANKPDDLPGHARDLEKKWSKNAIKLVEKTGTDVQMAQRLIHEAVLKRTGGADEVMKPEDMLKAWELAVIEEAFTAGYAAGLEEGRQQA